MMSPSPELRFPTTGDALDLHHDELVKGVQTRDHMNIELLRVKSFKPIPPSTYIQHVWPTQLASAGFYFDDGNKETECFECGLKKTFSFWEKGTDPFTFHKSARPRCRFILGQCEENVPLLTNEQRKNLTSYLERGNGLQRPAVGVVSSESVVSDSPSAPALHYPAEDSNTSLQFENQQRQHSEVVISLPNNRVTNAARQNSAPFQSLPTDTGAIVPDHPNAVHTTSMNTLNSDGNGNRSSPTRRLTGSNTRTTPAVTRNGATSIPSGPDSLAFPSGSTSSGTALQENENMSGGLGSLTRSAGTRDQRTTGDGPHSLQLMRQEEQRLKTFQNRWPVNAVVAPADLARAGFFYTGSADRVQCAFCENVLRNWEPNDNPMYEHRRHFPRCRFVLQQDVGNIPILPTDRPRTQAPTGGMLPASHGPLAPSQSSWSAPTQPRPGPSPLGVNTDLPKHPDFAIEASRLLTYRTWRIDMPQPADVLCRAGFFYTGQDDNVRCFFCDGGLRNWEHEDDPFTEHARWFPRCSFIREVRGNAFVDALATRYPRIQHAPSMAAQEQVRAPPGPATTQPTSSHQASTTSEPSASSSGGIPGVHFRVEEREVKARVDTPAVRAVLDMGFDRSLVMATIRRQLREQGEDFSSAEQLLEALFQEEDSLPASFSDDDEEDDPAQNEPPNQTASGTTARMLPGGGIPPKPPETERPNSAPVSSHPPATTTPTHAASAATLNQHSEGAAANVTENTAGGTSTGKTGRRKKKKKERKTADSAGADETPPDDSTETRTLLEENRALKDQRMCKVCMDAEANIVFLPCGHLVCCANCAPALRNCAVCRSLIRGTVRTYLS